MEERSPNKIVIRKGRREDCEGIMELKQELAVHQNMGHLPRLSVEELQRDGFDVDPPCYHCIVAEMSCTPLESNNEVCKESKLVGYALYFYAFGTTLGKALHLEDLCVSKNVRGGRIGSKLISELAKIALENTCTRMQLEVLDWNDGAIKFYEANGGRNVTYDLGIHNYRLDRNAIERLLQV